MKKEIESLWQVAENKQIERIKEGKRFSCKEVVVKEEKYQLFINGGKRINFSCTPKDLEALAVGYAFSETLIREKQDIKRIEINKENREILLEIKEGNTTKKKQASIPLSLATETVFQMWRKFDEQSQHFQLTGGLHGVALYSLQDVLFMKEDVARHNALLKVLGAALLEDIPLADKCLFFSGRVAAQMVEMLAKSEIKILLCHGAATFGAVEEAEKHAITLAGFIRDEYMNIYTGSDRIKGGIK